MDVLIAGSLRVEEARAPYRVAPLLTDHLDTFASAPEGFKRLRELVLNLAVRGRLMPQDANDEPATEAMSCIAYARDTYEIKSSKARPRSTDECPPYNVPNGWTWARLSDLTRILNGRAYAKEELLESGTPVLRVGNLFTSSHWYYSNLSLEKDKYCDAGDLLFAWSASFGPFIWKGPRVIFHYHIWKLSLFSEACLSKDYLYTFLVEKTAEIKAAGHGVSMVHMTKEKMEQIFVPVPPLAEQSRIVAKVEELMALIAALEAKVGAGETARGKLLDTLLAALADSPDAAATAEAWAQLAPHFDLLLQTPADVDRLQQTLLQLAVKGRLVPQDPNDEPAAELLKRIRAEKDRLVAEGKIKRDKPLQPIGDDDKHFDLPEGWEWIRLGAIGDWGAGATPLRSNHQYFGGGIPWFKSGELVADEISTSEETITEKALNECSLRRNKVGDVLIAMYGATIGKTSILAIPATTNQAVCACTLIDGISNRYLLLLLKAMKPNFIGQGVGGAQPNISREKIIATVAALPPTAEQSRIVAAVAALTALCDRLRERLAARRALSAKLAAALTESALQ